jgi:hypothetical protein
MSPISRYCHTSSPSGYTPNQLALEDSADKFAAALLLPAAMLLKAIEKLQDVQKVAQLFGVDALLIERRLDDIAAGSTLEPSVKITVRPSRSNQPTATAANDSAQSPRQHNASHESRTDSPKKSLRTITNSAHMVREKHHLPAPTPRAVAAQSYNNATLAQESTSAHSGQDAQPETKPLVSGKGMDRLREIARMLDKSGR